MQFGMPTLIELQSLEECAALCHELGLSFVELSMDMPEYQEEKLDISNLRYIAEKYGIYYTIHLEGFLDPCAFNKRVVAAYIETVLQIIKVARNLSIPILNMHLNSGDYFTLPDRKIFLYDKYKDDYAEKLVTFRDVCTNVIGQADIKICIENCGDYENKAYIRKGLELLLESPVFELTLDVGHNASADYTDEPAIMKHIERLHHMHLHDAKGRSNHLVLGDGNVDIMKYINLAKKQECRVVLEVKTVEGLRKSVAWLRENCLEEKIL